MQILKFKKLYIPILLDWEMREMFSLMSYSDIQIPERSSFSSQRACVKKLAQIIKL